MTVLWILAGLAVAALTGIALAVFRLLTTLQRQTTQLSKIDALHEQLEKERTELQSKVDRITDRMTENMRSQFASSTKIIQDVTEKLTKLDETNTQVLSFSQQLKDLQALLQQPKGKGIIGEYWLETLLGHVLPPGQYKMQYKFSTGETVDAVIFFQEKIIPIDAKFSTEQFSALLKENDDAKRKQLLRTLRKDLKTRIDETAQYVRPHEGTTEFAIMFVPSDSVYYDLLAQDIEESDARGIRVIEYAFRKCVTITGPTTFFGHLQTILQGLKAFRIHESMRSILHTIEALGKHLRNVEEFMQKLGKHLGTTVNTYDLMDREFQKVDRDILKLTGGTDIAEIAEHVTEKNLEERLSFEIKKAV